MKTDINNIDDIITMVDAFYVEVRKEAMLKRFFTQADGFDWDKHISIMYSFWENVLFSSGNYEGNPLEVHKRIQSRKPTRPVHFDRWLALFDSTVDRLFEGPNAEIAKQRAHGIAHVMMSKI